MLISKQTSINNKNQFDNKYATHSNNTVTGLKGRLKMRWKTIKWILENRKGNLIV